MKKILRALGFILSLFLYNCGTAAKKTNLEVNNKTKLEREFQRYKSTPYKYGGTDKRGFDCSGFVNTVYRNAFYIELPRTTSQMAVLGTKIKRNQLKIGDLVFFQPTRKYKHIGIYVGGNQFIHSSTSKGVIKSSLDNVYWTKKYRYARRVLK